MQQANQFASMLTKGSKRLLNDEVLTLLNPGVKLLHGLRGTLVNHAEFVLVMKRRGFEQSRCVFNAD